jgi:phospholipid/cholesterol/gamma-HCH transport system ATP-binding protein
MLYDEPTTGLDPITTYTIDALIVRLRKELGVTTLIVSHDVSSVFRVADRIAFLHEGRLTFVGTPEEFQRSHDEAIVDMVEKAQATTF